MLMKVGIHEGTLVETLVLKRPDYVAWVLTQTNATAGLQECRDEAIRLIEKFDAKPILRKCHRANCPNTATRYTVYVKDVRTPFCWCSSCDPHRGGAEKGKLTEIISYKDALRYVAKTCKGGATNYKALIRAMAITKGLPERAREADNEAFFG